MNSRKQALTGLLGKVEAGAYQFWMGDAALGYETAKYAEGAFLGSLDAALALHNAVLGGWGYTIDSVNEVNVVNPWVEGDAVYILGAIDRDTTPARAMLIAIIKALIAQEDGAA